MDAKQSSWAAGPDRGLYPVTKSEDVSFSELETSHTYHPELMSDSTIRSRVQSSGYGRSIPSKKQIVTRVENNGVAPWEEHPSFTPNLKISDPSLRESAHSSGYGKSIPQKKIVESPRPDFKPKIFRNFLGQKMKEAVPSSGYGRKEIVVEKKQPQTPPRTFFKPKLPKSALRESVQSSGYGVVLATHPSSAPPKIKEKKRIFDFDDEEEEVHMETKPIKPFVLDGVSVANNFTRKFHAHYVPKPDDEVPPVPKTPTANHLKQQAPSSGYGVVSPPQAPRPHHETSSPTFKFSTTSTLLPVDQIEVVRSSSKNIRHEVNSSGYGVKVPPSNPKPERVSSPVWRATLKPDHFPATPPPVKSMNGHMEVNSHGYGSDSYTPVHNPRTEKDVSPVWVPTKAVKRVDPVPPPRSRYHDEVSSHYGADYNPAEHYVKHSDRSYSSYGDEVDVVETRSIRRTSNRVTMSSVEVVEDA